MPQTLEPDVDEALELFLLEEQFNDDATCQINHQVIGLPCSIVVTAIGNTSCGIGPLRMCEIGRAVAVAYQEAGLPCLWCTKTAADCWTIIPA